MAATGHCHPEVVRAVTEQAAELLFYSTAVRHPVRDALAEKLVELCPDPLARVFLCNSGAEANENALHLARRHTGRPGDRLSFRRVARADGRHTGVYRRHPV